MLVRILIAFTLLYEIDGSAFVEESDWDLHADQLSSSFPPLSVDSVLCVAGFDGQGRRGMARSVMIKRKLS